MTSIGDTFTTGQEAPVSGVYAFVRHMDWTQCTASPGQRKIPLSKGETFPPHGGNCNAGVVWRLDSYA